VARCRDNYWRESDIAVVPPEPEVNGFGVGR